MTPQIRIPLTRRALSFYWRTHLAVVLGVAAAGTTLVGALLVGDSMRASLREVAFARLGGVDYALVAPRFFRQDLADNLGRLPAIEKSYGATAPVILLKAGVSHAETGARSQGINLWGVDRRFWKLSDAAPDPTATVGSDLVINEALAREIGVQPGDDVLIRVARVAAVSPEMLFGRREDGALVRRVTVRSVVPTEGMGRFDLSHAHSEPRNAYMSLARMQRWLDRRGRVNALLVGGVPAGHQESVTKADLQAHVNSCLQLDDLGLRLRVDEARSYLSLESESFLLPPAVETAAAAAGQALGLRVGSVLSYLANWIDVPADRTDGASSGIPYSIVTALDQDALVISRLQRVDGTAIDVLESGDVLLNSWAANDLQAAGRQGIRLSFFVTGDFGQLETRRAEFRLREVVNLAAGADDPGFTPEYPGVTDTENIADWDPPFPVDLGRVRDADEEYWRRYRTTPKAFLSLADGLKLWTEQDAPFGRLTSMRLAATSDQTSAAAAAEFEAALIERLGGEALGLRFSALRQDALQAAAGSTDFSGLFIGFSMFLIFSAAMLVSLMFRLGVERRAAESGLLLAVGFSPRQVVRLFLSEGLVVALIGMVIGLLGSLGYAWLMLAGLRSWWSDAVQAPFVNLHVSPTSLFVGAAGTVLVGLVSVVLAIRGLQRFSVTRLLAGSVATPPPAGRTKPAGGGWAVGVVAGVAMVLAMLPMLSESVSEEICFFLSGAILLVAYLVFIRRRLRSAPRGLIAQPGARAMARLGLRNAPRHPGRSTQTIGLIASAVFIIAAVQAFRIDTEAADSQRSGGTGGFSLFAESTVPIMFDVNTAAGREALGIAGSSSTALDGVSVMPFRLRPGDDSSCRNLYVPTQHRIIGAGEAMIDRGGFSIASSLDRDDGVSDSPWHLLNETFDDGAIPAIGDESAVKWQLHSGLGRDLAITDEHGRPRTLRFVALLRGSVLQGELVVSESAFTRLFPSRSGYGFFLISTPQGKMAEVSDFLERELARFGFDARSAAERLAGYRAVQNTYLSVFQMLGGLGLILGTVGLAAVLLRNVWERRSELALMRAVGFDGPSLAGMVLAENALLVVAGLLGGLIPALLAIAPHILRRPQSLPWLSMALILAAVFAVGMISALLALLPTLRANLIPSLRQE